MCYNIMVNACVKGYNMYSLNRPDTFIQRALISAAVLALYEQLIDQIINYMSRYLISHPLSNIGILALLSKKMKYVVHVWS